MSRDIRISTITPCFRMKPYLFKFLEELPKQTIFQHLEVVLDHNDPDEEELVWVADFQKKHPGRLKHIVTRPVDPIGVSMNRCITEASAEYVSIWNVDDLRTPDSLEKMVDAFEAGADIVYGDFIRVRSFGSTEGQLVSFQAYEDSAMREEFTRSMLLGPFMAFRKSLCEKAGMFDEQFRSGADFDLAIRLAIHGKPVRVSGILGYYLDEGKGASTRPGSRQPLERTAIELRYGIYDKLNYHITPRATQFDVMRIVSQGKEYKVADVVPDYEAFIKDRQQRWARKGMYRFIIKNFLGAYSLVPYIKSIVKPYVIRAAQRR